MGEPQSIGAVIDTDRLREAASRHAGTSADNPKIADDRRRSAELLAQLETVRDRRWRDLIPPRFHDATVDDLTGNLRAAADRWIDGGLAANVILLGPVGVGKTHTGVAFARAAFDAGRTIRFVSTDELLEGLRPSGGIRWRPDRVDVLVLDDLGREKPTDWSATTLDGIIDRRWKAELPTIVTSNLDPDALATHVGPRLWSRLYDSAVRHTVAGDDRRIRR